jgi:hypothetical protein
MKFSTVSPESNGASPGGGGRRVLGLAQGRLPHLPVEGVKALVLGRNVGMTYLLQGLLATFVAIRSGVIALIGWASRRKLDQGRAGRSLGI